MDVKQFVSLQLFELAYIVVLAFFPFVIALPAVAGTVLVVMGLLATGALMTQLMLRKVKPDGKVVFITGCDSGFGNALAKRLDLYGFTVVAACLNTESDGAEALKASTTKHMHVYSLDVTKEESVEKCLTSVKSLCKKGLWALVNNAGIAKFGDVEFTSLDCYKEVMEVNLVGTIRLTKACLPLLRKAKGRVINVSGSQGLASIPGQSAWSAACFAIEGFTDALRMEVAKFEVKVITIRPGNFVGATGILNRHGCEKIKAHFTDQEESADKEVVDSYGSKHIQTHYKELVELSKTSASNLQNVVLTMESAVINQRPSSSYLVNGGAQLIDTGNILVKLKTILPTSLMDSLQCRLYHPSMKSY